MIIDCVSLSIAPVGFDDRHSFVTFIRGAFEIFVLRKQSVEGLNIRSGNRLLTLGVAKWKDQPHYSIQEFYSCKSELNNELSRQASRVCGKITESLGVGQQLLFYGVKFGNCDHSFFHFEAVGNFLGKVKP